MQDYTDLSKLKKAYIEKNHQLELALFGNEDNPRYKDLSIEMAKTEKVYRIAKSKEFLKLKLAGQPVTLIPALAAGRIAEEWQAWKIAESVFHACRENIKRLHKNIDSYQSLLSTARSEMNIR